MKFFVNLLLSLTFFFDISLQVTLNCEFENYRSFYETSYACKAKNLHVTLNDRDVKDVQGTHVGGKNNSHVVKLFVKHQNCLYIPLGVGKFFPNLEILYIMMSNLQFIMSGDLEGLNKLKIFDVSHNPIDQIGQDFFKGANTIEKISFYDCHIKKVAYGALEPLVNLKGIYFDHNVCIDLRFELEMQSFAYEDHMDMDEVKADIYDKCSNTDYFLKPNYTEEQKNCMKFIEKNEEGKVPGRSNETILIVFLIVSTIFSMILLIVLIRIFRNKFRGSWVEMQNALTS